MQPQLIAVLSNVFSLELAPAIGEPELETILAQQVNHLIQHDFNRLVSILYRIDVSEQKLKQILKDNPDADAGLIIARMMIERQKQKISAREEFKTKTGDTEEEKW